MKRRNIITYIAVAIGSVSLIVNIITGYFGPKVASDVALIILILTLIIWLFFEISMIKKRISMLESSRSSISGGYVPSHKPKLPYTLMHHELKNSPRVIDDIKNKVKIPCDFLQELGFTIIFWVQITKQFCNSTQNRYLFAYTTDDSSTNPDLEYPNSFFLGIEGGTINWRFVVKGPDPSISTKIPLSTAENLQGWKLFTVRWFAGSERRLTLTVDEGTFKDETTIKKGGFPVCGGKGHFFHLGGWLDTWKGGISFLKFYNFRVYNVSLSDEEIRGIYNYEKLYVNNL